MTDIVDIDEQLELNLVTVLQTELPDIKIVSGFDTIPITYPYVSVISNSGSIETIGDTITGNWTEIELTVDVKSDYSLGRNEHTEIVKRVREVLYLDDLADRINGLNSLFVHIITPQSSKRSVGDDIRITSTIMLAEEIMQRDAGIAKSEGNTGVRVGYATLQ